MKLIDKYLLRSLAGPLLYCLLAFVMIFIVFDLFDNLPEFLEGKTPLLLIAKYYAILLPSVVVQIVPVSLLLAVLYALYQLTKNNELTAMRASGVSLIRLMTPFATVGLLISLSVGVVNETIGPRAAFWCNRFISQQKKMDEGIDVYKKEIAFSMPGTDRDWYVGEFDMRTFEMRNLVLTQQRQDRKADLYRLTAARGRWLDEKWWFSDVRIQRFDDYGDPKGPPDFILDLEATDLTETPREILNEIKDPQFLSSFELMDYIRSHRDRGPAAIARITTDLHNRLSMPWACFIVTLLGIPFGNQTGRKGALLGVVMVLGMFFGYYLLTHLGLWSAKQMLIPAWLGGWLPNLIFLIVGLHLVWRMR